MLYTEELPEMPKPSISSAGEAYCMLADVIVAMNGMNPSFAEAFGMHRFDGFSYEEISRRLKIPIGTVRSRIHRAQAELECTL